MYLFRDKKTCLWFFLQKNLQNGLTAANIQPAQRFFSINTFKREF